MRKPEGCFAVIEKCRPLLFLCLRLTDITEAVSMPELCPKSRLQFSRCCILKRGTPITSKLIARIQRTILHANMYALLYCYPC